MKRILVVVALLAAASSHPSSAEETNKAQAELKVIRSAEQRAEKGSADKFTGEVSVESRFASEGPDGYRGGVVRFSAGARTAWHSHGRGQTLIVTSGRGRVQSEGTEVKEIGPGDVVWIPANVKHWHGATPDSEMTHVAIVQPKQGSTTTWMEPVSQEEYLGQR